MNYIQEIMEALRAEFPGKPDDLLELYALLVLVRGAAVEYEDVHDAWSIWQNRTRPDHKSLIPFDNLTPEVQELDAKYADGIRKIAVKIFFS